LKVTGSNSKFMKKKTLILRHVNLSDNLWMLATRDRRTAKCMDYCATFLPGTAQDF